MRQMKEQDLIKIGGKFINALAAQFQLPEARNAAFAESKATEHGITIKTAEIEVEPTGQIAAIVKSLSVRFEVSASLDGAHIRGTIHYSYGHHSLGSNGSDQRFIIVTEERYGSDQEFVGTISEHVAYRHEQKLASVRRAAAKPATATISPAS